MVLVMVGSNTGQAGILGNVVIANNIRNGIAVIGSLFVVFVLFIFLEGIAKGKKAVFGWIPLNEWTMLGSALAIASFAIWQAYRHRLFENGQLGEPLFE